MSWTAFLLVYFLGGVTFLPLIIATVLLHLYYTSPYREDADPNRKPIDDNKKDDIVQPGDDVAPLKAAQKDEAKPRVNHADPDVAAGYFAVCREYTPMGINAKPIERSTPVGSATVAAPSPSVYQTMYRSIFDRKQTSGPLDNGKNISQRPKKAGNVFYVVLRHGHLMLFDDDEQLEVRHVVSLAHHDITLYSGEEPTPEGELFIKRNAIRLSRKPDGAELGPDSQLSKPFFLFSENCSAKEDFYFALLRNQQQSFASDNKPPAPIPFEVKNIIALVQKLHSSEEHMQTRWLNALLGRIFLGVYKTKDMEDFIREKLMKKISRVKKPSFLSNISIKAIDIGESGPYITNPRLRDLTVEGECGVEADVRYTGNFRLEVAATARIDLGTRFKAREVNLVLAVVVRKLEGHMLFKIKPPPSNRIWFSFQQMPKVELAIEPIVSSRQITYTVILRQIENRIKEVIAETLVLPFWDDVAFFRTEHKKWRGGIFDDNMAAEPSSQFDDLVAHPTEEDDLERQESQEFDLPNMEKSHSMPVIEQQPPPKEPTGLFGRKLNRKKDQKLTSASNASSTSIETVGTPPPAAPPRTSRSASFVHPPTPVIGTDATHADIFKPSSSPPDESPAAAAMAELSAKSRTSSAAPSPVPSQISTPAASAFKPYITSKSGNNSSGSSREETDTERDQERTPQARRNTATSNKSISDQTDPASPSASASNLSSKDSIRSQGGSITRGLFGRREHANSAPTSAPGSPGLQDPQKRTALAAVSNAAASAKRWGLDALQRHKEAVASRNAPAATDSEGPVDLTQPMGRGHPIPPSLEPKEPMGRGRPLPPPGQPLPMPDKRTKMAPIPVPKRRPVPPPPLPARNAEEPPHEQDQQHKIERRPVPPPPLPRRRNGLEEDRPEADNMLVVEAPPAESEPTTPASVQDGDPNYGEAWMEDDDDMEGMEVTRRRRAHSAADGDEELDADDENPFEGQELHESPRIGPLKDETHENHEQNESGGDAADVHVDATNTDGDDDEDDEFSAWMDNPGPEEPAPERPPVFKEAAT